MSICWQKKLYSFWPMTGERDFLFYFETRYVLTILVDTMVSYEIKKLFSCHYIVLIGYKLNKADAYAYFIQ